MALIIILIKSVCILQHFTLPLSARIVFTSLILEYMELGHAEKVPSEDMNKDTSKVFYLPRIQGFNSTTKIRAIFDASAKSSSNDLLLVGPTVHSPLIGVLLSFRFIALVLLMMSARCTRLSNLSSLHHFFPIWERLSKTTG